MLWINFLHLYQPANTDAVNIKEATEASYLRIIRALEEHSNLKFTLNISGCLVLRWKHLQMTDLLNRIKKLVDKGQIELTGSAAYHPLLPLISKEEAIKQIKENEKILRKLFGKELKLKGFFMPEMAYGPKTAKIIKKLGYEWIILDEISYNGKLNQADVNKIYKDKNSGLKIILRTRVLSSSYVPETLNKILEDTNTDNKIVITATDGELYGLRHGDPTAEFEKLLKNKNLETKTISEFMGSKKVTEKIRPVACNWESTEIELLKKQPYISWFNKKNKIQLKLWKLTNLAEKTINKYRDDDNYYWARWHFVRGLASCTFWWASAKDFSYIFGPLSWNPDEIERGVNELIRSIRALEDTTTRQTKIKAEKLYIKIKKMVWKKHWTYYWKNNNSN